MITISHHDERYLALRNCYAQRDAIKAIADYPDVMWNAEAKIWLLDNRLFSELIEMLGPWLAPAPVEFWCDFNEYAPPPVQRKRTKREIMAAKAKDKAAAGKFGRAVVDMMHGGE